MSAIGANRLSLASDTTCAEHCQGVIKDARWMGFISELFGTAGYICSLTGSSAADFVPYLTIFSAPLRIYHAKNDTQESFGLMADAIKTSRVADTVFWAGRGVGSMGDVINDIIKPFAGGVVLAGLGKIACLGLVFSVIIPAILIGLSAIGGAAQAWTLKRSLKMSRQLKAEKAGLNGSLNSMERVLHYLEGPSREIGPFGKKESARYALKAREFNEHFFNDAARQEILQKRIEILLGFNNLSSIRTFQELIAEIALISEALPSEEHSFFQQIDETLTVSQKLLSEAKDVQDPEVQARIQRLEEEQKKLQELKTTLYNEGASIVGAVQSENTRKIRSQILKVLAAALMLAAAIMFLVCPQQQTIAYSIALTSCALGLANIIYVKAVFPKQFKQTHSFLHLSQ